MSATVAIVAGGGGPLGHATAVALAADGLTVVAVDRTEHALSDLPEDIRREVADATGPAEAARLIDRIAGEAGPPDALDRHAPAGTPSGGPAPDRSARRPPRQGRTIKALGAALPLSADDAVSMARVRFRNRRSRRALPGWAAP